MGFKKILSALVATASISVFLLSPAKAGPFDVAVIVGNKNYAPSIPSVQFAIRDAKAVRRFVVDILKIDESNIIELLDAKQSEMLNVFGSDKNPKGRLFQYVRQNQSNVFVFYSGHGVPGPESGRSFLLPVDADPDFAEINGYPLNQLYKNLSQVGAKSVQVFIDACFSGQSAGGPLIKAASPVFLAKKKPLIPEGITVVTAAEGNQLANWDLESRHGLFTNYFLEGAYGAADEAPYGNGDSKVTLKELQLWLNGEMSYVAKRKFKRNQTPFVYGKNSTIIAAFPSGKKLARPIISDGVQKNSFKPSNMILKGEDFVVHSPIIYISMPNGEESEARLAIRGAEKYLEEVGNVKTGYATLNGLETIVEIEISNVLFDEGKDNKAQASQVLQQMLGSRGGVMISSQSSSIRAQAIVKITARSQLNGASISATGSGDGIVIGGSRNQAQRKAIKEAIENGAKKLSRLLKPYFAEYALKQ